MDDSFSSALKEARKLRGWTQDDLAKQLGVSQQSVQKWEAGTSLPRTARRDVLVRALGIDMRNNQDRHTYIVSRLDGRTPKVEEIPASAPPRISGRVRESAFMAAVEQALTSDLHENLDPPRMRNFRFATDYLSSKVAVEFLHMPSTPISSMWHNGITRKLWALSTLRLIHEQADRTLQAYVLLLICDDPQRVFMDLSRWGYEATMHGIQVELAENAEAAASIIMEYEKGSRPIRGSAFDEWEQSGALTPEGPDIP